MRCSGAYLYVRLADEPGPVRHELVDLVQVAQLLRRVIEPAQPALVAALQQELRALRVDEIRALVTPRRLQHTPRHITQRHEFYSSVYLPMLSTLYN